MDMTSTRLCAGMAERDGKCVLVGCFLGLLAEAICAVMLYLFFVFGKEALWTIFKTVKDRMFGGGGDAP